jgi:trehalose-phosphatase
VTATDLPLALDHWRELADRLAGRRRALFLDYDGTLSPIAARPELATLPPAARDVLRSLAARAPLAVLSGRGRADVAALVDLPAITYAGSHGFDIAGPPPAAGQPPLRHEVGPDLPARMERIAATLRDQLAVIPGALVESKRFSVAVHYRLVDDRDVPRLETAVDSAVACAGDANADGDRDSTADGTTRLRKAAGKKVFEIRPDVDWDKGKALLWLLARWGLDRPDVVPIYIGDDVTDEDAFAALAGRGIGILVAETPRPTAASYRLRDPAETLELLRRLDALG